MTDVWSSVHIYGPASEVQRFKDRCVRPTYPHDDESYYLTHGISSIIPNLREALRGRGGVYGDDRGITHIWEVTMSDDTSSVPFSLKFDCGYFFPVSIFQHIARVFPRLSFDSNCIHCQDQFMGYGWFNPPTGGEDFRQDYKVPKDYWTSGPGHPRSVSDQKRYEKLCESLTKV